MPGGLGISLNKKQEGFHLISKDFGEELHYYVENILMLKELALILQMLAGKIHDLSQKDFVFLVIELEGVKFRFQILLKEGVRSSIRVRSFVKYINNGQRGTLFSRSWSGISFSILS